MRLSAPSDLTDPTDRTPRTTEDNKVLHPMNTDTIKTVAVIGLGTMGHGIAQAFVAGGYEVWGYDQNSSAGANLKDRIAVNLGRAVQEVGLDPDAVDTTLARIRVAESETQAVAPAQFVTECVAEELDLKRDLFTRIESAVSEDAILASNTSSFPMTQISAKMKHPERAVNTHWFNPPHIVPTVEVVPGKRTSEETAATVTALLRRIGKLAIQLKKEIPGFLVNRIQIAMHREIFDLMEQGVASPEEIDLAVRGSVGLRLAVNGPIEVADFAGHDVGHRVYQVLVQDLRSDRQVPDCINELVEQGHYGAKTGKGVFEYPPEVVTQKLDERERKFLMLAKLLHDGTRPDA